jgi:poly(3-hydroxybutyrate) depolymerase
MDGVGEQLACSPRRRRGQPHRTAIAGLILFGASVVVAAEVEVKRFESTVSVPVALDYLLYLPDGYEAGSAARTWPLVLFLHGSGGYGETLDAVRKGGLPKQIEAGLKMPAIVVAPQAKTWWDETIPALAALLGEVASTHRVDPDRVYVTGLSAGGSGTWALLLQERRTAVGRGVHSSARGDSEGRWNAGEADRLPGRRARRLDEDL